MADLRGACRAARPVIARVVGVVGIGAPVPFRAGENLVLNRRGIADAVNDLAFSVNVAGPVTQVKLTL